jgi:predicted AAA+ superfamily ATPase
MYIRRTAEPTLVQMATEFYVLAVTGPRQSGKTTLVRHVFPDKPYASLENPDTREFALRDPRGLLNLLPFSLRELTDGSVRPGSLDALLLAGGYPPVHDAHASPERWYNAYIDTYVERDMRQLVHVRDIDRFQRFMRLCADSIGQLVNMTRIGSDCGVDQKTVKAWLAILETGFVIYRLRPHHENLRKRLVKTPKLYFHDTGLAARLLGIEKVEQLVTHRMRGALFENWVVSELLKGRRNLARSDNLFFWRDNTGAEVDIIVDRAGALCPIEVKSGMTIAPDWFDGLAKWHILAGVRGARPVLVYGGDARQSRDTADVLPWLDIGKLTG